MGLNEKEKLVLARVWKTVNNTSKPTLGFDDGKVNIISDNLLSNTLQIVQLPGFQVVNRA